MHFGTITFEPSLNRVPIERDTVHRITIYGRDNLYPQRMLQTALLSPITKSAIRLKASFYRGNGFERGDKVINDFGETANDILRLLSEDIALYNGYGLHLNSTGIGIVKEVQHIPFENIRLGLATQNGIIRDVRVSNNWQQATNELPTSDINERRFLLFDHAGNGREALTTSKGMVLYVTPKKNKYPLSTLDAIVESCQSDFELQNFELGNITNGFLSMSIFKYRTSGDTELEEEELREKLNGLKGARNANSVIVVGVDEDDEGNGSLVEAIPANNNDSLFINTVLNVRNRILQNYNLPASIMGMLPAGSLFTAQQIADDFTFQNLITKDTRNEIARQFDKLGLDVGEIIPNQFASSTML